ncbi:MAG: tetratricopeptide repeat protein, partial [Myxococcales bacterium]|nr:tetratricopeptide repeat protein [Myxococcales bacterium]
MWRLLLVAWLSLWALEARADAVPPPPDDCPAGAVGETDHGGPHCRPTTCEVAQDCEKQAGWRKRDAAMSCRDGLGLCVVEKVKARGGWGSFERDVAYGPCASDADCRTEGARCLVAKRCVFGDAATSAPSAAPKTPPNAGTSAPPVPTAGEPGRCGCELRPTSARGWIGWCLAVVVLGWRRRRRDGHGPSRWAALLLIAAASAASPAVARAQAPAEGEKPTIDQAAMVERFDEAQALYREGRFGEAAAILHELIEVRPEPVLYYNLARAHDGNGELAEALTSYRRYLELAPEVADRGAIERRIATLEAQLAERERLAEAPPPPPAPPPAPPPGDALVAIPWALVGVGAATIIAG